MGGEGRGGGLRLHHGDLSDSGSLINLIREIEPDEVYHLGAQSHVKVSFETPEYTADTTGLGTIRNSYPSREGAPTKLMLSSEMGSVRVEQSSMRRAQWRPTPPDYAPPRPNSPAGPAQRDDPELDRILKMVEAGELSAHDADELLKAMGRV